MKEEEIKAINLQLFTLFIFLLSVVISILITYNQKLNLENKNTIFNSKETYKITLFNRILITTLSLIFIYVNYKLYKISKEEGENLKPYILQILAGVLTTIADFIALYVVKLSTTESIVDVENPII